MTTSVYWLRRDLRLGDNPALLAAREAAGDSDVAALFVIDEALWRTAGAARRAWLAATLRATSEAYDGKLTLRVGDPRAVVPDFAREVDAGSVHVARETTPYGRRRDRAVESGLADVGVDWVVTGSPYAIGPGLIRNKTGDPYQVFTPFARAWREHGWPAPATGPRTMTFADCASEKVANSLLEQAISDGPDAPEVGERAALERWRRFRDEHIDDYADNRDRPDLDLTSRLSPHLKLGTIHPRTLLADLAGRDSRGVTTYINELAWREFYADVLWHQPATAWADLRPELSTLAYDDPQDAIDAWRTGTTGYPIVDAGMRQLLAEGWMHNRVRMITGSFLTKDLHVWWPVGARHFLQHLVDGDVASNNHGWQWVAGTGTDAAPYFRVFNPITQGLKFDPHGDYVRRWLPELRHLDGAAAHEPWKHLDGYSGDYPKRIVDHAEERVVALDRYQTARK